LLFFDYASRSSPRVAGTSGRASKHDRLFPGAVCGTYLPESGLQSRLIEPSNIHSRRLSYFAILRVFTTGTSDSYCAVIAMETEDGLSYKVRLPIMNESIKVLLLNRSVRRVAAVHLCHLDSGATPCHSHATNNTFVHSTSVLKGSYRLIDRKGGFPPHAS